MKTQGEAGLFLNLLDLDNAEAEAITVEIPSDYRSTTIQIVKDHVILNDRKMLSVYDLNTLNLKYLYNSEENIGRVIKVSDKLYFDLDYGDIYTLDLITGDISLYIVEKEFANATESTIHNISRAQSSNEEFLIISHQSNSQNWITKMHINKEISWSINQSARNLTFLDQMIVITNIDSLKYIDSNSGEIIFTDISPTEFIEIWSSNNHIITTNSTCLTRVYDSVSFITTFNYPCTFGPFDFNDVKGDIFQFGRLSSNVFFKLPDGCELPSSITLNSTRAYSNYSDAYINARTYSGAKYIIELVSLEFN